MGQKNKIDFIEYEYKTNKKMSKHQELFDYFENEHNVLLLESEMKEIINIVDKIARNENKTINIVDKIARNENKTIKEDEKAGEYTI